MAHFNNRGHYCNYCRKVVASKCGVGLGYHHTLNKVLWHVWENSPERVDELLVSIKAFTPRATESLFNKQIKSLYSKFSVPKA